MRVQGESGQGLSRGRDRTTGWRGGDRQSQGSGGTGAESDRRGGVGVWEVAGKGGARQRTLGLAQRNLGGGGMNRH